MFSDKIYYSWKKKQSHKYKAMLPLIKKMDLSKSLDVGAGRGYFEEFLKKENINFNIICTDKQKYKNSIKMNAEGLSFSSNTFTSIICIDTIHLIKNTSEIKRVLKPNGKILLSIFFNKNNLEKKKEMLTSKFPDFNIIKEKIHKGKENELIRLIKFPQKNLEK